ncbi:ATP-dependent helicase (plasmid) [Azospirillum sp. A29]|uniref:ATP-dependent helicase n=1 Tax=Azospirillum sp. A29 TaxID=3160606 RepID=UPI00366DA7EB
MTTPSLTETLGKLTAHQREAVNWQDGALLVLAGPGSGKTRVLTSRIARILDASRERAFRVLALTFTNKAADEMAGRVLELVPGLEQRTLIGTFHSFCMQLLQQHGSHIGIRPDFAIYSLEEDRKELLREGLRRSPGLDDACTRYLPAIDKLKARLIAPDDCARQFKDAAEGERIEATYRVYEAELARANALDFGSLIERAYALVSTAPGVAMRYRRTYTHWLIDEFQDTTDGQYRLIKALAGDDFRNIVAVADDDQIIYQWNGASYRQIQRFRADFSPQLIQLPTNYRCPPAIVAAANRLVTHNAQRTPSKLPLEAGKTNLRYPPESHIRLQHFPTEGDEAAGVAADILERGRALWGETVVLARTRALLEGVLAALRAADVPASIAQRRDDFRSPHFQWLSATLRQAARPLDRRAFDSLVSAFNRLFALEVRAELVASEAEGSSRGFLAEWALTIPRIQHHPAANALAEAALALAADPGGFRAFIDWILPMYAAAEEPSGGVSDLSEDRAAWSDLVRSIGQTIGRDAPLDRFLQELAIRSKEAPVGADTVTLMTVHGSKGKEFDHVYVIGLAEDIMPSFQSRRAGDASAEMEEERRNCFVAITRARECLTLSWAGQYRGWSKPPSRFLEEMGLATYSEG